MNDVHALIRTWPSTVDSKPDADKMNQMRLLCIGIQDERDTIRASNQRLREALQDCADEAGRASNGTKQQLNDHLDGIYKTAHEALGDR